MPSKSNRNRMARLEGACEQVSQRLTNIDTRLDTLGRKVDLRFDALDKKIDQSFRWAAGIVLTTCVMTIASIHLHH